MTAGQAWLTRSARMLVESDGSTSGLLEALTGESLSTRVDAQGVIPASRLPEAIRAALGLCGEAAVLERRSCLITPEHEVVSINRVVVDELFRRRLGDPDTFSPLGAQLRDQRIPLYREQLTHGLARWRDSGRNHWVDCIYIDYVLNDDTGGRAYVHVQFNPRIVGISEAVALLLSAPHCARQTKGHVR